MCAIFTTLTLRFVVVLGFRSSSYVQRRALPHLAVSGGDGNTGYSHFERVMKDVRVQGNTTATLVNLISLGDDFKTPNEGKSNFYEGIPAHWQRVPGCMADARVFTTLDEKEQKVKIGERYGYSGD